MLNTEEYYTTPDVGGKKVEMYMTNNNIIPDVAALGQQLGEKIPNTALLNELGDYKPINGGQNGNIDEQRALQLALELSMLGLTNEEEMSYNDMNRIKKSMNMTECVPVPSSEHVAEIVGRQGKLICKSHKLSYHFSILLLSILWRFLARICYC